METYTLNNGLAIPKIGFGTWQLAEGPEAYQAVQTALEAGYRHIDTAQMYGNEASIGRAICDSGLAREEVFVTTKLWNTIVTYEEASQAIDKSLESLGLGYVDLFLIHWPNPAGIRGTVTWQDRNAQVWRALEDAYEAGKVKAIGLANFMPHHIDALLETARVKPMVDQVLLAPGTPQEDLDAYAQQAGILLEAYSPLGTGGIFKNPDLADLANKYQKSVAQVALAWSLQKGFLPLPKSNTPANILANLDIFDIDLDADDVRLIDQVTGVKGQQDPDTALF